MAERPKRRWYQFTVGGLLVLTTCVSLPLGWFTYQRNKVLKEQQAADRFHKLIRDTSLAVQSKVIEKRWEEVKAQFAKTGYQPLSEEDERQDTIQRRFLIRDNAWTSADGSEHRLILDLLEDGKDRRIFDAEAGVAGSPNLPWDQAVRENIYPSRSVVALCLVHDDVVQAAKDYPILKEIEVTYDIFQNRWDPTGVDFYGFYVKVDVGKSQADDRRGRRLLFWIRSNLDPPQDRWTGKPISEGFSPSSFLGKPESLGGSTSN